MKDLRAERASKLAQSAGLSKVISSLLVSRGVKTEDAARKILSPSMGALHDPSEMLGMELAVRRILQAIDRKERVLLWTDFDTDGTTSAVILRRGLKMLGLETDYHIPHRFTEGYGINQEMLEKKLAEGYRLMISADCGITAHGPVRWARDHGMDIIVTDHHLPDASDKSPDALAVLNPNQKGCPYPDKMLAGVGVAWKLIHALLRTRGMDRFSRGFLKVAAIGTVVDMAPLAGENRVITSIGLEDLPKAKNAGLRALLEAASLGNATRVSSTDLSFKIGPRINAAGRMDTARIIVELFEAENEVLAREIAGRLDQLNGERRKAQEHIAQAVIEEHSASTLSDASPARVVVVAGEGWHRGVVGIAASKVVEHLGIPSVIIALDGDEGHGSARSIPGYHLLEGLNSCGDLLVKFGGHAAAAGLTIRRDDVEAFRTRLNSHASKFISEKDLEPRLEIDMELKPEEIGLELCAELRKLEPFGNGWPPPIFGTKGLIVQRPVMLMGKERKHVKIFLRDAFGRHFEAVWWGAVECGLNRMPEEGDTLALAYSLEENTWNGETRPQLMVKDIRFTSRV